MKKKSIMNLEYKWEVLLVYVVSILGFIFSFMKDKEVDPMVKEQYNQAGVVFIINFVLNIASKVISYSFGNAYIGYIIFVISIVTFVFSVIAVVKAFSNESYQIPIIYDLSKAIWK